MLFKYDGLINIVAAMNKFPSRDKLQLSACNIIWVLSYHRCMYKALMTARTIQALSSVIQTMHDLKAEQTGIALEINKAARSALIIK